MKGCLFAAFLLSLCFATQGYATPTKGIWTIAGSAGASTVDVDDNTYVASGVGWPRDKFHKTSTQDAALVSASVGYTWAYFQEYVPFLSLNLVYAYAAPATVKGNIEQFSLPAFKNYDYSYKVSRQTILAEAKADIICLNNFLMPYVAVAAGASINRGKDYRETALPGVTPRVSPGFTNSNHTSFAYRYGVGLDFIAGENTWITFGVNRSELGHVETGKGVNAFAGEKLRNDLSAYEVLLGMIILLNV